MLPRRYFNKITIVVAKALSLQLDYNLPPSPRKICYAAES